MYKINIKKTALITILIFSLIIPTSTVFAIEGKTDTKVDVDKLINEIAPTADKDHEAQLTTFKNLPNVELEQGVGIAIKTVLRWSFYLTLISLVVASIYYIMSMGKEEDITKARNIILYLVIGMAIIAGAYGIVAGVSQFDFFDSGTPTESS
jgi:hypothetical protein